MTKEEIENELQESDEDLIFSTFMLTRKEWEEFKKHPNNLGRYSASTIVRGKSTYQCSEDFFIKVGEHTMKAYWKKYCEINNARKAP